MSKLSKQDIAQSVESTLDRIVPKVNDRTWVVEYLYRHKIGNKLPRGKKFNIYRGIESKGKWINEAKKFNCQISNSNYTNRISPFLLSQLTFLSYATMKRECQLNTGVVFDVIKMLEGDKNFAPSTELSKHRIAFNNNGILKNYEHSHVPMLPNAYLEMMAKLQTQKRIVYHIDDTSLAVNIKKVENEVKSKGASKPGRMTGHWMVTRTTNGKTYYLGVFPHSRGALDDHWIYEQVIESERYLNV
ncbi:hypothetical protein [Kangiella koreensis]|uniref:hypothetical protein n=1 Tax=Kangiella koreensis TaxID=261964 RepID=UPI0002D53E15|nr:hypothetical protein [Kangiella koreensis]